MINFKTTTKTAIAAMCLLSAGFLCGCTDSNNLDGKLIIMDGKVYRLENRFAEGYWFIEKPASDTIVLRVGEKH